MHESATPTPGRPARREAPAATLGSSERRPAVLLVDDSEDNRTVYAIILRYGGYRVIEAADGREALQKTFCEHPAAVVIDVSIPIMDGWEAVRRLKDNAETRDIPVIGFTADVHDDDRHRAARLGFASFLAKPVAPRELLAALRRVIRPRDEESVPAIS